MSFASQALYGATHGHEGLTCDQAHSRLTHAQWEGGGSFGADDPHGEFMEAVDTWCDERPESYGWGYENLEGFADAFGGTPATIRRGSRGVIVLNWQQFLNSAGFPVAEDSKFGKGTQRQTAEWQKSVGLSPDGVVGPLSWAQRQAAINRESVISPPQAAPGIGMPGIGPSTGAHTVVVDIGQANSALQANAPPGTVTVTRIQGITGPVFIYKDARGNIIAPGPPPHLQGPGRDVVPVPDYPGQWETTPGQVRDLLKQGGIEPEKADMKPLWIAGGIGLTAIAIIALTVRR